MKITNEEALNIVLSLAQIKLNEIRVERIKKTNSMLENVEIIKYKKAMEIVKEFDGRIVPSDFNKDEEVHAINTNIALASDESNK